MGRVVGMVGSVFDGAVLVTIEEFAECVEAREDDVGFDECVRWEEKPEIAVTVIGERATATIEPEDVDKLIKYLEEAKKIIRSS